MKLNPTTWVIRLVGHPTEIMPRGQIPERCCRLRLYYDHLGQRVISVVPFITDRVYFAPIKNRTKYKTTGATRAGSLIEQLPCLYAVHGGGVGYCPRVSVTIVTRQR